MKSLDHSFKLFIVVTPGLEDLVKKEISHKWPHYFASDLPNMELAKGGVELTTSLLLACQLNQVLKIPNRILLRLPNLENFKCRDLPKLFNKLKNYPWRNWLMGQMPQIQVSSSKSRLFDSRKISKTIQDSLTEYYRRQPPKKVDHALLEDSKDLTLFIRFEDDFCTMSLDLSGERLHKRGERPNTGHAPIRENIAAGLFFKIFLYLQNEDIQKYSLIDPMCGTGTLLNEAKNFFQLSPRTDFPYKYIPKINIPLLDPIGHNSIFDCLFQAYLGKDSDPLPSESNNAFQGFEFQQDDIFSDKISSEDKKQVLICNPPYGKRVPLTIHGQKVEGTIYFKKLIEQITRKYEPKIFGLIIPHAYSKDIKHKDYLDFENGGIKVRFLMK